jgi:hypothetical protein
MPGVLRRADLQDEQGDGDGDDRIAEEDDPRGIAFGAEPPAGPAGPPRWRRGEAHAAGAEPGIRECAKVSECYGLQCRPEVGQLTRRSARSPRSALGLASTVINSAALLFVPYEGLQAEVYRACRILRNQAATSEGAKR